MHACHDSFDHVLPEQVRPRCPLHLLCRAKVNPIYRAGELRDYVAAHGDAHVGFREQDDAELARWAAKQRKDWKTGDLAPDRCGSVCPSLKLPHSSCVMHRASDCIRRLAAYRLKATCGK